MLWRFMVVIVAGICWIIIGGGRQVWWFCWLTVKVVGFVAATIRGVQPFGCLCDGCVVYQRQKTVEFWSMTDADSNGGLNGGSGGRSWWCCV